MMMPNRRCIERASAGTPSSFILHAPDRDLIHLQTLQTPLRGLAGVVLFLSAYRAITQNRQLTRQVIMLLDTKV
jgi:hypothetical protein